MITITRLDHRKARPSCYSCDKESDYKLLVNRDGGTSSWNIGTALCLCDECLALLVKVVEEKK